MNREPPAALPLRGTNSLALWLRLSEFREAGQADEEALRKDRTFVPDTRDSGVVPLVRPHRYALPNFDSRPDTAFPLRRARGTSRIGRRTAAGRGRLATTARRPATVGCDTALQRQCDLPKQRQPSAGAPSVPGQALWSPRHRDRLECLISSAGLSAVLAHAPIDAVTSKNQ